MILPGLRDSFVDKKKYGFFRRQLDPLSDDPHELGHCNVRRDQILPLVNVHNL